MTALTASADRLLQKREHYNIHSQRWPKPGTITMIFLLCEHPWGLRPLGWKQLLPPEVGLCPFAGLSQWGNITPSSTCHSASFLQSHSALLLFCSSFSHLLHGRWESAPQASPGRAKYVGAIGKTAPYGSCLISEQKLQFFENWWALPVWKVLPLPGTASLSVHCTCPLCPG